MNKILKSIFGDKNVHESTEPEESIKNKVQVSLKDEINSIVMFIPNIKCIKDFFTFYNEQILMEKDKISDLIDKGKNITGVVKDAITLKSYIDTIDRYALLLKSYKGDDEKRIFIRLFEDRYKDLLLVFCDYSSVFNGNGYADLYVHGINQYSDLSLDTDHSNYSRLNISVTYKHEYIYDGYTLEVNKIKSARDRRRSLHGQKGIESLKMLADEINTLFKYRKENDKGVVKIFGHINPDENDISYSSLVGFYRDKCTANIVNDNFEINVKI